ncbi:MAG TPA: sugar transferase [Streptosporangiaceae bacterium]|nr:sugar transferase [Streptosporangiaceae bacterium]
MTSVAERGRTTPRLLAREASKRVMDLVVSLALIVLAAPLLLLLWLAVRLTSRGPALFRQERLGRAQKPFTVLKLRTMHTGSDDRIHRDYVASLLSAGSPAPARGTGLFKLDADPRVTRVGVWLRRTSLDELPQLINVLRGEMSLVGPRPVLPWEAQMFPEVYERRFAVKPGITGLWQVSGRSRLSMRKALELDVEYVHRRSFAYDLGILFRTLPALFRGDAL